MKQRLLIIATVLLLFLVVKVALWSPYFPLVKIQNYRAVLKIAATVICFSPTQFSGGIQKIGESWIISDSRKSKNIIKLINDFPPPNIAEIESEKDFNKKVRLIRKFVHGALPNESALPQYPEPSSALTLLGQNKLNQKYPRLCSKLAKIFVQYLYCFGIQGRIVQLHQHISTEVWNPKRKRWEYHDTYFDAEAIYRGKLISASEAHDLMKASEPLEFKGPYSIFHTVVHVPQAFLSEELPRIHYFNYDNLSYWQKQRSSPETHDLWK